MMQTNSPTLYSPLFARVFDQHPTHQRLAQAAELTGMVGARVLPMEQEATQPASPPSSHAAGTRTGERDIYRNSLLRYAGYVNELTEATKSAISPRLPIWNKMGWTVAITYTIADIIHKVRQGYRNGQQENQGQSYAVAKATSEGIKAGIFQGAATDFGPVFVAIRPIEKLTHKLVNKLSAESPQTTGLMSKLQRTLGPRMTPRIQHWAPAVVSLATIPFIPKLLDPVVEKFLHHIYEPFSHWVLKRFKQPSSNV